MIIASSARLEKEENTPEEYCTQGPEHWYFYVHGSMWKAGMLPLTPLSAAHTNTHQQVRQSWRWESHLKKVSEYWGIQH